MIRGAALPQTAEQNSGDLFCLPWRSAVLNDKFTPIVFASHKVHLKSSAWVHEKTFSHPPSQGHVGDSKCADPTGKSPGVCNLLTIFNVQCQIPTGAFPPPPPKKTHKPHKNTHRNTKPTQLWFADVYFFGVHVHFRYARSSLTERSCLQDDVPTATEGAADSLDKQFKPCFMQSLMNTVVGA